MQSWIVHKFGGTSVAGADRYRTVADLIARPMAAPGKERKLVVVSAMSKVTDALLELVELARRREDSYKERLESLKQRHLDTLAQLLPRLDDRQKIAARIEADFGELAEILRGVWLSRIDHVRTQELVSGHGEIWSAQLLDGLLRSQGKSSRWLDAREVLTVEPGELAVNVVWDRSRHQLHDWIAGNAPDTEFIIATGFVASTADGIPTTLRRNGSDYSASIFGSLLASSEIVIWTDVDGVLSADPRLVPEAVVLDDLSYDEATELAYFGAKVVHPSTMAPAIEQKIPIRIRNTFNPNAPGSVIRERSTGTATVKGFSTIEQIALVNVEGTGMIGVPGVAQRLFGALREVGVSVVMISQASSEHSICFAIPERHAELARQTLERAFFAELHHGQINRIEVKADSAILAAVGDNMVAHTGVAARFFGALGRAGVNIRAIAQGSSERNISVVVARGDAVRALRAVHSGFFLSPHTLSIGVIGPGLIGTTFLRQLAAESDRLRGALKLDLRVRGIIDSKRMTLDPRGIDLSQWKTSFDGNSKPSDLEAFLAHIQADHLPHAVLIDCTSSEAIAARHAEWLARGFHVITPNKKGNTGPYASWKAIRSTSREKGRRYLYETTVGAGLPILTTLQDLVQTGDRVDRIDGVLSGTLSYLFNAFTGERPFSEIVKEARARGYTEPDPRDDLSGMDVARKLVILAREIGMTIELADVDVESLVPADLRSGSIDDFMQGLPRHDSAIKARVEAARARSEVLRYTGTIETNGSGHRASVQLRSFPAGHAFSRVAGSDNIVAFQTARYHANPLVVQGPGAGPEVTAAGVFGDLLRLAGQLGAQL